jgi:tetratricopeptide (TPR) repeat protein
VSAKFFINRQFVFWGVVIFFGVVVYSVAAVRQYKMIERFYSARSLYQNEKYHEAASEYEFFAERYVEFPFGVAEFPTQIEAWTKLAETHQCVGDFKKARIAYLRALESYTPNHKLEMLDPQESLKVWRWSDALSGYLHMLQSMQQFSVIEQISQSMLRDYPGIDTPYKYLETALHVLERHDEAFAIDDQELTNLFSDLEPRSETEQRRIRAVSFAKRGMDYAKLFRFTEAEQACAKSAAIVPGQANDNEWVVTCWEFVKRMKMYQKDPEKTTQLYQSRRHTSTDISFSEYLEGDLWGLSSAYQPLECLKQKKR